MATETSNPNEHLLPARHAKGDLFICDVADAILKDIMPQMEHPFYSLSKKPETKIRRYEHNGSWLEIIPSVKGLATIYDKDILIYCISQVMEKIKRSEPVGQRLRITSHDLLVFTNRGTAGKDYDALCEAIDRLAGTRITTNIHTGDEEQRDSFGLIDASSIRRKHGMDGRLLWVEIKLSDWVFNAIRSQEVLTLNRDYFRLGKPLERRIYELARKHCGRQPTWQISLETLLKKSGSQSPIKLFRQMVKNIAKHDHLPDYHLIFDEASDLVLFTNREGKWVERPLPSDGETLPPLPSEAYEEGRIAAPGYDIHGLESEWREWWASSGKPKLDNPAAAFVGFCRSRHKRAPIRREVESGWDEPPAPKNENLQKRRRDA
jgi:plasmid replication initiation protein